MNENNFENNGECDFTDMIELIEYQRIMIDEWKSLCEDQKRLIDLYKQLPNNPKYKEG